MTDAVRVSLRALFARHPASVPLLLAEVGRGGPKLRQGVTVEPAPRMHPYHAGPDHTPCEGGCLVSFVAAGGFAGRSVSAVLAAVLADGPGWAEPGLTAWFDDTDRLTVLAALAAECEEFLRETTEAPP